MISKNSFSKPTLRDGMRRNLWCVMLSALGFLMTQFLPVLMTMQSALEEKAQNGAYYTSQDWARAVARTRSFLGGDNMFVKLVLVGLAIVCGVAMFRYLHSRQQVDFYHSMPVSRTRLSGYNYVTGILCVLPGYAFSLVLTFLCVKVMGFGEALDWSYIFGTVASNLIFFLLIYVISVLSTILCGNTVVSLLLQMWLQCGFGVALTLEMTLCSKFFQTYAVGAANYNHAVGMTPILQCFFMNGLTDNKMTDAPALSLHVAYLVAAVLLTALCLVLFRIRKSERAGTALAFDPAKLPVKIVMCVIAGVAFGAFFNMLVNDFWFWPGMVIGVVLMHWLVEIIYAFDFHAIFKKPIQLLCILVGLTAVLLLWRADIVGYDKYLPKEDDIVAVDFGDTDSEISLTTPENITAVRRLAEMGIEHSGLSAEESNAEPTTYFGVAYRLKSGRTVYRSYWAADTDESTALMNQVWNSAEYKRSHWKLFQYDPADSLRKSAIQVCTGKSTDPAATTRSPEQVQQIVDTLREETLADTSTEYPVITLVLGYQSAETGSDWIEEFGYAYVTAKDVKTLALIEQFTGEKPERLTAADVTEVELDWYENDALYTATVTDKADLQALLEDVIAWEPLRLGYDDTETLSWNDSLYSDCNLYATTNSYESVRLQLIDGKQPDAVLEKYKAQAVADSPDSMDMSSAVSYG